MRRSDVIASHYMGRVAHDPYSDVKGKLVLRNLNNTIRF